MSSHITVKLDIPDAVIDRFLAHQWPWWIASRAEADWKEGTAIKFFKMDDEPKQPTGTATVDRDTITAGLSSLIVASPRAWSQAIKENDDMVTCDLLLQHIVFGRHVYD